MITSAAWQTMQHIPFDGIKAEFDDVTVVEPEHAAFLFLLRNDQRRHLHGYYEQIDQHKVELLIPFYDARLLQIIVSASTLTPFLYHNFYHQWLQLFPEQTTMIPWQTYPGHLPCPVPKKEEILSQWQMYHDDKFRISQRWMKSCWSILGKRDFPRHIIRRPVVLLAILLHKLKIRNYAYIFKFCINLYEHISKCQPSE